MNKALIIGIILFFLYLIYRNFIKYPYRYVGYYYPNLENLNAWVESKPFKSVEDCRYWAEGMADRDGVAYSGEYDYECGKDCYKGDPYSQGVTYTCHSSVD